MNIKEAAASYFVKLERLYQNTFGTLPTVSWSPDLDQELFIGTPNEDGEIQWKVQDALPIRTAALCKELRDFYSSYYYWELRGKYRGALFDFPAIPSATSADHIASSAIADGEYYFPNQDAVLIASCSSRGNDDFLLFYRQKTAELFVYDVDKKFVLPLNYSLTELIGSMKAVI